MSLLFWNFRDINTSRGSETWRENNISQNESINQITCGRKVSEIRVNKWSREGLKFITAPDKAVWIITIICKELRLFDTVKCINKHVRGKRVGWLISNWELASSRRIVVRSISTFQWSPSSIKYRTAPTGCKILFWRKVVLAIENLACFLLSGVTAPTLNFR